ncbi:hypothetical protein QAD02_015465 [Eretmocerus hayati]|uniref:Uncharacterized protein n=1 Tax=Eretmocerus hayati TaxID=131215 RepID=A0ACC2P9A4_9HYME|nr:hypothetical protein QAD02_015465 [Eretmocerus hayati]
MTTHIQSIILSVTMILVQIGISSGWSSPYLAKFTSGNSTELNISLEEASWVASLLNLGRLVGAIVGSIAVNYIGSKCTLLWTLVPMSLCWCFIMLAKSATCLYIGRFCGGLSLGMTYSSFPLFLGEVALPEIRGSLVSFASAGGTFGLLISFITGSFLDKVVSAAMYLVPCFFLMILFAWLPESPHHLVRVGKTEKAKKSIAFYRAGVQLEEELDAVTRFVANADALSFGKKLQLFRQPAISRATLLIVLLWSFNQLSGFNSVLFYMEIILKQAKAEIIEPKIVVMMVSAAGVVMSIITIFLVDSCGRRPLLMISSLGVSLSMASLGVYFTLMEMGHDISQLQWLPIMSIFSFNISFFMGMLVIPSTVLSELFPSNIKCIAACFASVSGAISSFISTKSYQPLISLIGQGNVYFMHAFITILIIPYAYIFMPETKGKTLQQIQDEIING